GDNISGFCVIGTGTNLTYQWYKNSAPIAGATNSCFTKTNVQTSDGGQYFVRLTTRNGTAQATVDSATATLTVNAALEKVKVVGLNTFSACAPSCGSSTNEGNYIVQATLNTKTNVITAYLTHICRYPTKCSGKEVVTSAAKSFSATETNYFYFTDLYGSYAYMAFYDSFTKCLELSEFGNIKASKCFDAEPGYLVTEDVPPSLVKGIGPFNSSPVYWETASMISPNPQGGALCVIANGTNLKYQWYLDGVAEGGQTSQCFKRTNSFKNGSVTSWTGTIKVKVSNSKGSIESSTPATLFWDSCYYGGCGY
ncbi:MAG: hypothetical protein KDD43_13780, partial [Bdellovibrionales bacterium]|nr:hypothetical protein [Bdellovibrionales bacterium]